MSAVPAINTLVEITMLGGRAYPSRVEDAAGTRLSLAAPLNLLVCEVPEPGERLAVRWAAGARGRYSQLAQLAERVHAGGLAVWVVDLVGPAEIQQERRYVRGGGGECVELWPEQDGEPVGDPVRGFAVDVAEGSVRGRFGSLEPVGLAEGDRVGVRLVLDGEEVSLSGTVFKTSIDPVDRRAEIVVRYQPTEPVAQAIRRYVFRLQALRRSALD